MLKPAMVPIELVQNLERCEIQASEDFFRAAPPGVAAACGLQWEINGEMLLSLASHVDVLSVNRVIGLGVFNPPGPGFLEAAVERYDAAEVPRFFVTLCPGAEPSALPGNLQSLGFSHYNNWVRLTRHLTSLPGEREGLRVEKIRSERGEIFGTICTTCFSWPRHSIPWVASLAGRPGWHLYLAFDGREAIATAAMYKYADRCWFGFAGTLPEFRGRGAQTALIVRRLHDAAVLGCREVVAETAEETADRPAPSFRNLVRLGFEKIYVRANYIRKRSSG